MPLLFAAVDTHTGTPLRSRGLGGARDPAFATAALLGSVHAFSREGGWEVEKLVVGEASEAPDARVLFKGDVAEETMFALVSGDAASADGAIKDAMRLAEEAYALHAGPGPFDATDKRKRAIAAAASRMDAVLRAAQQPRPCLATAVWYAPVDAAARAVVARALEGAGTSAVLDSDGRVVATSARWRELPAATRVVLAKTAADDAASHATDRFVYLPYLVPPDTVERVSRTFTTAPVPLEEGGGGGARFYVARASDGTESTATEVARALASDVDVAAALSASGNHSLAAQGAATVRSSLLCAPGHGMVVTSHAGSTGEQTAADDVALLSAFAAEVERTRAEDPAAAASLTLVLRDCTLAAHADAAVDPAGAFCVVLVPGTSAATAEASARAALRSLLSAYVVR